LLEKSALDITQFILLKISVCKPPDAKGNLLLLESTIWISHINLLLFLYGLYNEGHFGIEAKIEACNTVISFAEEPKYVCVAASTP
jgi:hypothetical protein